MRIMREKREETSRDDVDEVIQLYSKYGSTKFASDYASSLLSEAEEMVETKLHPKLTPLIRHLLLREQ
jgi:geranylgeranyl pyrophosphate synthase